MVVLSAMSSHYTRTDPVIGKKAPVYIQILKDNAIKLQSLVQKEEVARFSPISTHVLLVPIVPHQIRSF
jgi:hypothetical protein